MSTLYLSGMWQHTMSDRATWLSFKNRARLMLLVEGDAKLYNQYSVILVNPDRHPEVKADDARSLMDWLTSPAGQQAIGSFTVEGQVVFHPNAAAGGIDAATKGSFTHSSATALLNKCFPPPCGQLLPSEEGSRVVKPGCRSYS